MELLILALAVFRLSNLITKEDGPADAFHNLREWADDKADIHGGVFEQFAGLISCPYCISVWLALFFAGMHFSAPTLTSWLALPFALSAVTLILDRWING